MNLSSGLVSGKDHKRWELMLASTSPYRRELISRLGLAFQAVKPLVDEEALKNPKMGHQELAEYLALKKAESLVAPDRIVIGGDQLVSFDRKILGKPGTPEKALEQLKAMRGHSHELITSIAIVTTEESVVFTNRACLKMKTLTDQQLAKMIELDQPLDCAGSYKLEKHGIALFDSIECDDFTAIQGVPLMRLARELRTRWGIEVL
ncbi:MAG TPA: Maf family protein [Pseudobdellovibrionaceae bacterium]|nr:Maf family protein [Pseudobdellovibrionaceae bacterium]